MTTHEQRKRRNAGCRRAVPRPLLARRVSVNDAPGLDLFSFNRMVAGVRARREEKENAARKVFAKVFSPLSAILSGFRRSTQRKAA